MFSRNAFNQRSSRTSRKPVVLIASLGLAIVSCSSEASSSPGTAPVTSSASVESVVEDAAVDSVAAPAETSATEPEPGPTSTEAEEPVSEVRTPNVRQLGDEGGGTIQPLASAPLPPGYTEAEFVVDGEAMSYEVLDALDADGTWDAAESGTAEPYATRMIVRTPPADAFSGVVLVEWMNVTAGTDTTPDWGFLHEMIGREGHAYVAVSAQRVGIEGQDDSFIAGGVVDTRGLGTKDPERYGGLVHPGDAYAFDIFTQAGVAVADEGVLAGLEPTDVIALGESQSAFFMTTYVNSVHPLVGLYDGFLIHSRGGAATPIDGDRSGASAESVLVRTDLDVPVLQYETETDLFELGFIDARQPDTEMVRTWEVAGTAHADTYALHASGLPRDPSSGAIIGCSTPINDGPQHETLAAAVHHLVAWVVDGTLPPASPVLDVAGDRIVRDELGIATGGVRTPVVDAPLRVLSGEPGPDGGSCFLFGQTIPLDGAVLAARYDGLDAWSAAAQASADAAIERGWLLPEDAATMLDEANALAVSLGLE